MKTSKLLILHFLISGVLLFGLIGVLSIATATRRAAAQEYPSRDSTSSPYTLRQSAVAAGGRTVGAVYQVTTLVGQPAASSQGVGVYTLSSGLIAGPTQTGVPTAVQTQTVTASGHSPPVVGLVGVLLLVLAGIVWRIRSVQRPRSE